MKAYLKGHHKSPTYNSWCCMRGRCNNPHHSSYKYYGGRGITYDPKWENYFEFLKDMGERPPGKTLGRLDSNKGYYKENCQWSAWEEQGKHKRPKLWNGPYPQVGWHSSKRLKAGGQWVAKGRNWLGKNVSLYCGPSLEIAIEARKFYESFFLGETK
jgi:hypothetical protein